MVDNSSFEFYFAADAGAAAINSTSLNVLSVENTEIYDLFIPDNIQ